MKERFNLWLEEVPPVQRRIGLSVLFCVILGNLWVWSISPTVDAVINLEEEIKGLDEAIMKTQVTLESESQKSTALHELEQLVLSHKESLGVDGQAEDTLAVFSRVVKRSGLNILFWKPVSEKYDELLKVTIKHVQVHVDGQFHQLAQLLDELSLVMPNIQVEGFNLHSHQQDNESGDIQATLRFEILSPSQRLLGGAT
jgi:Tfp pilus assembly protein PilO